MPITFIDSAIAQSGSAGSTIATVFPAGIQDGYLGILCSFRDDDNSAPITAPVDWTKITEFVHPSPPGRPRVMTVFTKNLLVSDTAPTLTSADSGTEQWSVSTLVYSGHDSANIFDVVYDEALHLVVTNSDPSPDHGAVTTVTNNAMIIDFGAVSFRDITSVAPPPGSTSRVELWGGSTYTFRQQMVAEREVPLAGTTIAARKWVNTAATPASNHSAGITLVLREGSIFTGPTNFITLAGV